MFFFFESFRKNAGGILGPIKISQFCFRREAFKVLKARCAPTSGVITYITPFIGMK